jgi:hypothetical protein
VITSSDLSTPHPLHTTCPGMLTDTTVAPVGANAHAQTASLPLCEMSVTVENTYLTADCASSPAHFRAPMADRLVSASACEELAVGTEGDRPYMVAAISTNFLKCQVCSGPIPP